MDPAKIELDPRASDHPLVSICITTHNYGRFLAACVDSVISQSYPNIECIVVDDASDDDTPRVLAGYAGLIRVLRHDTARGQLAAIGSAFSMTSGSFIAFVDADDTLYPDFVRTHVAAHQSPGAFAAMTGSLQDITDADGKVLGTHPVSGPRPDSSRALLSSPRRAPVELTLMEPHCNPAHQWLWSAASSLMFRRDVLHLMLVPPPDAAASRIFADTYLAHFAHAIGGSVRIDAALSTYRRHGGNFFADNLILGGSSPATTRRHANQDNLPAIAAQIMANREALFLALGARRFVELLAKFCRLSQAAATIRSVAPGRATRLIPLFIALRMTRRVRAGSFWLRKDAAILTLSDAR